MLSLYFPGNSILHRCPAGAKLVLLVIMATGLFLLEDIRVAGVALVGVFALYFVAKISAATLIAQIKPVAILLVIILIAQGLMVSWSLAFLIIIRFAALILAAGLVTLTTLTSDMVAAIEAVLRPFSRWVPIEKVSLALSLSIRFIPVIAAITQEVKEAQRARGLERSLFAVAMPVIIRSLKMGTQIAEALDARSYEGKRTHRPHD